MDTGQRHTFGALLRRRRLAAGLSQEQLAERAGLTAQAIGALERGTRRVPYRDTVRALARALGLAGAEAAALEGAIVRARTPASTSPSPTAPPLPLPPSPLVGRAREVVAVLALLHRAEVRLVTLTGPGGVGKTRLALQVAREAAGGADGAAFVALAPLRDPDLVVATIAHALGVREQAGQALPPALRAALRDRDLLLVLDNFEHVAAAAPLVADLLAACPRLRVLVTSRARLRVGGEHVYPVPTLPVPDPAHLPPLAALAATPAVALLLQRATAAAPNFALDAANAAAIAALCAHLDGLPLALELAAARLTVLSPALLLRHLTPRLPALAGNARDLPERQRTLRATLDWSHALLGVGERAMFRRLAVFAGGGTLSAVDAVYTAGEGSDAPAVAGDAVERLGALLDQSLLRREDGAGGAPRFAMLEIVREYAAEQLAASGEEVGIRRAHAAHYLALAEGAVPELGGPGQLAWLGRLEDEHDNVRAALAFARDSGDAATVLRLAGALWRFWSVRGHVSEGRRWLREAMALTTAGGAGVAARTTALRGAALLAFEAGALDEAAAAAEEALARARARGDGRDLADTLHLRGILARQRGDYAAATVALEEALAVAAASAYQAGQAAAHAELGMIAFLTGDAPRGRALLERSLALHRARGDTRALAGVLRDLGWLAWHAGEAARGEALRAEALGHFHALGDAGQVAETLWTLGIAAQSRGDLARATALHEESLALRRARGDERGTAQVLAALAQVALHRRDLPDARTMLAEALATARRLDDRWPQAMALALLGHVALVAGELARDRQDLGEAAVLYAALGNPLYLPWCLEGLAGVAVARGRAAEAARLCGAREALLERLGPGLPPADPVGHAHTLAAARAALGAVAFALALAAGRALSPEDAIAAMAGDGL